MKVLLTTLVLCLASSNTFAFSSAVEALRAILPPGEYKGNALHGECSVKVEEVNFPKQDIKVTVTSDGVSLFKLVEENSVYAINVGRKFFLQSDRTLIGKNQEHYVERLVKTVTNRDDQLNVLVSEIYVIANGYEERTVECNLL